MHAHDLLQQFEIDELEEMLTELERIAEEVEYVNQAYHGSSDLPLYSRFMAVLELVNKERKQRDLSFATLDWAIELGKQVLVQGERL